MFDVRGLMFDVATTPCRGFRCKKPTQLFKLGEMKTEVWDESIRNGDESDVPFDAACRPAGGAEAACPIYVVVQGFEVGRVTREKRHAVRHILRRPKNR